MRIEASAVKGFQDYLPPESLKRAAIRRIAEKYYSLYGFLPVETPIIEFDELMRPDANSPEEDEAIADRFKLKDKGGRNLGLRYEFTFQLSRIFKENPNIKLPFRRYQIDSVFRDEPIRKGRTRQFVQCDADIIGDSSVDAEAECLALMFDIFKELGIEAEVQINNRKLLNAIIASVEIESTKQVLRELDKLEKVGVDNVKSNLKRFATANQIITLFKILEKDISFFKENKFEGAEELDELEKKCRLYGIKARINSTMTRGFSYYTGNVFEFFAKNEKNAIAAGGRYDKTIGKYLYREIPAVGVSFSIEALTELCANAISKLKIPPYQKAIVISIGKDKEAISLTRRLRKESISCTITREKIGKAMEYANAMSIPFVIFLGEEEVSKSKIKLKDMSSGEEKVLSEKQLISKLKK